MKKLFTLIALAASVSASAQGWQQPEYTGKYQPLTPGDTVYIYNTEAKQFLTEANDWGTHASVGFEGLRFFINQGVPASTEWDGVSYTISVYTQAKGAWMNLFITDGGNIYTDYNNNGDIYYTFTPQGSDTYTIAGSPLNATWTATGEMDGYQIGRYTKYVNAKDAVATGTGVIYDYNGVDGYAEGEFQTTWAFVSESDYAEYLPKVEVYNTALQLAEAISKAEAVGVDVATAKAVYDNTSSTVDQLRQAIADAEAAIVKYYEETVTPDNPLDMTSRIANAACDAADGSWINEMNCDALKTNTWVPETSDEGATDGTYLDGWGASAHGKVYQTITGLPNGIYRVSMGVLSQKLPQAFYANENRKDVPAEELFHNYSVITNVTDGTIEFGLQQDAVGENWFCFDNAQLQYLGSGTEAYRQWLTMLLESAPQFDEVVAQDSLIEAYNDVLSSVQTVQTKEEILGIIPAYEAILNEINLNTKAYTDLQNGIEAAQGWLATANGYYGELVGDYILETAQPAYEEHTLSTDRINAIVAEITAMGTAIEEYGWALEEYNTALEALKTTYDTYSMQCAPETADMAAQLLDELATLDMNVATTESLRALLTRIYDADFKLQIPTDPATDDNPIDYTTKIQYPSFYDGSKGWVNEEWSTCGYNEWHSGDFADGLDELYLNLWNATGGCRVYQIIDNLPAGTYTFEITVYANAEGVEVYANDQSVPVIVGNADDGKMGQVYAVNVDVAEDGRLEIGIRNTGGEAWAMADNCRLTYYGTDSERTDISDIATERTAQTAIYSLNGIRQSKATRGFNIIRQTDGSVKKFIKK